jgi:hypothetical protein
MRPALLLAVLAALPAGVGAAPPPAVPTFTQRASWVTQLKPAEQRALVNLAPDPLEIDPPGPERPPSERDETTLPSHFSWQDHDGVDWLMPVRNQRNCGSCAAFALTSLLEFRVKLDLDEPDLDIDLSDSHTLTCTGGSCTQGISLSDGIGTLLSPGIPTEDCAPYEEGNAGFVHLTACDEGCDGFDRGRVRLGEIERIRWPEDTPLADQVVAIKEALLEGPVLVGIDVYPEFFSYGGGVFRPVDEDPTRVLGRHALLLIGWDNGNGAWLVRNSWGADWGLDGYLWMGWGVVGSHQQPWRAISSEYRAAFDIDGDGEAARDVGGEDCDDWDAARVPGAEDVAGDGIDQDCDGADGVAPPPRPTTEDCDGGGFFALLPLVVLPVRRRARSAGSGRW